MTDQVLHLSRARYPLSQPSSWRTEDSQDEVVQQFTAGHTQVDRPFRQNAATDSEGRPARFRASLESMPPLFSHVLLTGAFEMGDSSESSARQMCLLQIRPILYDGGLVIHACAYSTHGQIQIRGVAI